MLRHPPINGSNTRCRSQQLSWSPVPLLTVKLQSRCKLVDLGVCRPGRQSCLGRGTLAHRLSPTTSGHIHGAAHRAASRPAAKPCAAGTWRVVPAPANAFEQTAVDRQHLTQWWRATKESTPPHFMRKQSPKMGQNRDGTPVCGPQ